MRIHPIMNLQKATIAVTRRLPSPSHDPRRFSTVPTGVQYYRAKNGSGGGVAGIGSRLSDLSNPRTWPRALVLASAATLFGYMSYKKYTYNEHLVTDDRHNVINRRVPPRPTQVVRAVSDNFPIVMNAKRYESLRKGGLGVDVEQ